MKKVFIILGLIVFIAVIIIVAVVLAYRFGKNEHNDLLTNKDFEEFKFKGIHQGDWAFKIIEFYQKYGKDVSVNCGYDINKVFTATVRIDENTSEEYVFDSVTGYAKEKTTGNVVDFLNGKLIIEIKDKDNVFKDNISLAIANVTFKNEEEFIEKHFESTSNFYSLTIYDFRSELERQAQYEDKYVIIPKGLDVKFTVYDVLIDDEGKILKNNVLIEETSEPIIIKHKVGETTTPEYIIELKVNNFEDTIPLVFSGESGKLDIKGHEAKVTDISIY